MNIVKVKITNAKSWDKKADGTPYVGQYGPFFRSRIQTDRFGEEWLTGFTKTSIDSWKGTEQELVIEEKEFQGKKEKQFRLPKKEEKTVQAATGGLEAKIAALEGRVSALEKKNGSPDF